MVRKVENAQEMLIFSHISQGKTRTDESDLIRWHYDYCNACTVKGINLLNALYHCNGRSIPMAFELVQKPLQRDMRACLQTALQCRFVLTDSRLFSKKNFDFITSWGKHLRL